MRLEGAMGSQGGVVDCQLPYMRLFGRLVRHAWIRMRPHAQGEGNGGRASKVSMIRALSSTTGATVTASLEQRRARDIVDTSRYRSTTSRVALIFIHFHLHRPTLPPTPLRLLKHDDVGQQIRAKYNIELNFCYTLPSKTH